MSQRIIQLLSAPEGAKIAYYNHEGKVDLYPPTCIALVEKGTTRNIVYFETVDNEISEVDIDDPDFLGFVGANDTAAIDILNTEAQKRFNSNQSNRA